ncbi:hypothetical protein IKE_05113 [Bacillus cereus VD196]|uniref:Uncharacterized protein n=1 Tax=Bacillus cereus VD196 TaxID=1053243 RepID=A0A9W5Q0Q2_BACCE|nr:hypothetical protein IKE_05113 [Bacillus cereus VD196]
MNQKVQGKKPAGRVGASCVFNGATYSDGSRMCQNNNTVECQDGSWKVVRISCLTTDNE